MKKVNTSDVRPLVQACTEFDAGKNAESTTGYAISGRRVNHLYVVYSYGYWPMYVCDTRNKLWFANAGRFSRTTSKHQSHARPYNVELAHLPTAELDAMIDRAYRT